MRRLEVYAIGVGVGLVLADSSIAVLALPAIRREFDVGLADLAWVLTTFNLALALVAVPASRLARGRRAARTGTAGLILVALASAGCALAPTFEALLVFRCVQAVGGAAVVVAALELLPGVVGSDARALRVWVGAGAVGAALGPAVGGVLTETVSWEAIFGLQVPLALAPIPAFLRARAETAPSVRPARPRLAPNVALALLSGGLAAALFLVVLLLVEGWRLSPIAAAAVVSVLPLSAIAAAPVARRLPSAPVRAAFGALLVAGGLAALGLLPRAGWAWAIAPQILVGAGLALALAALTEAAITGREPRSLHGGITIAARHAGVVLGLLVLTPVLVSDLDRQREAAEEAGTATVLDAPIAPGTKVELGLALARQLETTSGRLPDLGSTARAVDASPEDRPAVEEVARTLDDVLDRALTSSFSRSFLLASLFGLAALAAIATPGVPRPVPRSWIAIGASTALLLPAGYTALGGGRFEPPRTANPCEPRPFRTPETTAALAERLALAALDGASCELGVSREELTLGLASEDERRRFADRHSLDARQIEQAVRAGFVRAVDAAEGADAIDETTATVLRGVAQNLPLEALLADLGLD